MDNSQLNNISGTFCVCDIEYHSRPSSSSPQLERFSALVSQDIFSRMFQPWRVLRILNERKHFTHSAETCLFFSPPKKRLLRRGVGVGLCSITLALQMSAEIKPRSSCVPCLIAFSMSGRNNGWKSNENTEGKHQLWSPSIAQSALLHGDQNSEF